MSNRNTHERRIHPEMLVGVSAVVIGICALGVSLYETNLMREEQRAAVIPLLELGRSYNLAVDDPSSGKTRLSLHAENVGIGPAQVRDFRVLVDGNTKSTWDAAMRSLISHGSPIEYGQSTINGRTIPPDRMVIMFDLNDTGLTEALLNEFERLDFQACYCSVFDECWLTSFSAFGTATEVEACQRSESSFEE